MREHLDAYMRDRDSTARYSSFDHCFNHFQSVREARGVDAIASADVTQLGCLHLGFYLASWGMFRGRSALLRRSSETYVPVVEALAGVDRSVWSIEPPYDDTEIEAILDTRAALRSAFAHVPTDTLVTKVLLGVLGIVPAFDRYFRAGVGVSGLSCRSLCKVSQFWNEHAEVLASVTIRTLEFGTGDETDRRYPAAKLIDMVGYKAGGGP